MVGVPAFSPCASPLFGITLLTVAFVLSEELQFTRPVMSSVLLSLNVPVALYCCVVETAIFASGGVTAIEIRDVFTVKFAVPLMLPEVAVMTTVPCDCPVAKPVLKMDAIAALDEFQVTAPFRFWVLPSL
jgi:hypothetical protein